MDVPLERRRAPRAVVGDISWLAVPSTWLVQVTDVSLGGIAFTSPHELEIGRTVCVRAMIGRDAVNAQIRVCWSRPRTAAGSQLPEFEIGGVFLSLDDSTHHTLRSFLKP